MLRNWVYFLFTLTVTLCTYAQTGDSKLPSIPPLYPEQNRNLDTVVPIEKGDIIYYQVQEDREPPFVIVVDGYGEMFIPYYGKLKVEGMTIPELTEKIKALLENSDYKTATVLAQLHTPVKEKRLGRVYLSGRFNRVGAIQFDKQENMTVSKVILLAGGFSDFADGKKVKIIRKTASAPESSMTLDVEAIIKDGKIDKDIPVLDGDLIIAPQKIFNW